jgi:tetratricopeptide (TPR) repeat protein
MDGDVAPGRIRRFREAVSRARASARRVDHPLASERLVRLMRDALDRTPADSPRRCDQECELGVALNDRFRVTGQLRYLDEAVAAGRAAVSTASSSPVSDALRVKCLNNLSMHLLTRFQVTGSRPDLDEALSASQAAVDAAPPNFRQRGMYLGNLSSIYKARFDMTGDRADLTQAVDVGRAALRATSPGPSLAHPLVNLSIAVRTQAELTNSRAHLDEAIELAQAAVDITPAGDTQRFRCLSTLGNAYLARFEQTGDRDDATAGIAHLQQVIAEIPAGHPDFGRASGILAAALMARFSLSGDLDDAARAIDAARAAVTAAVPGSREHARSLSNLGGVLRARYARAGETADLDEAIDMARDAVAIPTPLAERVTYASNLSALLQDRFTRTGDPADLDKAIDAARSAVDMAPAGHPHLADHQSTLGVAYWLRFRHAQDPADLERSVEAGRAAVQDASSRHLSQAMFLHNLANSLLSRLFSRPLRTWKPDELTEVIDTARAADDAVPADHPNRVGYLLNLGTGLEARFRSAGSRQDMADVIACWRTAVGTESGPAAKRLNVARMWGQSAAELGMTSEAEAGFAAAVELLPLQAWRGLRQHTREEVLSERAGLASDAAAWAISNDHLERAVELLELGRNVLWSQMLQLRGDIDDLRGEHPGVARRLGALRAILDQPDAGSAYQAAPAADERPAGFSAGSRPTDDRRQDEARIRAAHDWNQLVAEVRALPGHASFLRAPQFAELTSDIGDRTVLIINVSRYRCDALAVSSSGVRLIPLPGLTLGAATEQADRYLTALSQLGWSATEADADRTAVGPARQQPRTDEPITDVLAWLGDKVTFPVLDALGYVSRPAADPRLWPRVWWCPTGPLTTLPLHAAGVHQPGHRVPAVLDRVVSSYLPTLRALYRADVPARAEAVSHGRPDRPTVLLVTMATTPYLPGGAPLRGAALEADVVARHFPEAVNQYTGKSATREAVQRALASHAYAHFACHGVIDPAEPSASGLCLDDGRLTIAALAERDLPSNAVRLAFLSACHSGSASPGLLDETITMAAALQLVGFGHVIATMWAIADNLAPRIADDVYQALASDPETSAGRDLPAAHALHAAISKLRATGRHPAQWAAYIHTGR